MLVYGNIRISKMVRIFSHLFWICDLEMKKIFLTITVILSLLFGLISCGGLGSEYNYNCLENDEVKFTISASFENDEYDQETLSRSITPDTSLTAYSSYVYYLVTRNIKSDSIIINPQPINLYQDFSKGNTGFIDMDLTHGQYEFTLFALKTTLSEGFTLGDLQSKAVLTGSTSVDLRVQSSVTTQDLKFLLKPNEVAQSSKVELKFYTTPDWTFDESKYEARAVMYDENHNIYGTDGSTEFNNLSSAIPENAQYRTTSEQGVVAGLYDFEVVFTKKIDTTKKYTFYSSVYVLPGIDTVATVAIPNVIEYEPLAPSNLRASFKDPDNSSSDYYYVDLTWDDNSNNEYYFQLELLTLDGNTILSNLGDSDTSWSNTYLTSIASTTINRYGRNYQSSEIYYDGSLMANNTSVQIKLPLGKGFAARICAVNDAGESSYAYVDYTNGGTGTTGYTAFPTDSKIISRYKVTYNFSGGRWTKTDGSSNISAVVEYHSLGNTSILQSIPGGNFTSAIKDGINWSGWRLNNAVSGEDYTSAIYTGLENLSLFAKYE